MKQIFLFLVVAVTAAATVHADLSADQLKKGQQLFMDGCQKCHTRHGDNIAPMAFTDAKWGKWLDKMMPISKLQGNDRALLTEYFAAVRLGKAELPKGSASGAKSGKHHKHEREDDDDKK